MRLTPSTKLALLLKLALLVATGAAVASVAPRAPSPSAPRLQLQYPPTRKAGTQEQYRLDRDAFHLSGPVQSVFEEAFNLHEDGEGIFTGNATYVFDQRGRLVEFMRGNNVMRDLYDDRYTYRADGRVAGVERFFDRKAASRDVYVYDDARRRVEVKTYRTEDNFLGLRMAIDYDAYGNETRNEIELLSPPGDDKSPVKHVTESFHEYDGRGRPVSTTVKVDGLSFSSSSSRRDADGRLVTTSKYLSGAARGTEVKSVVMLDPHGDELSTESYAADGTLTSKITYEHKLDSRGNWVEEVTRVWEKGDEFPRESSFFGRRKITYFPPRGPKARATLKR